MNLFVWLQATSTLYIPSPKKQTYPTSLIFSSALLHKYLVFMMSDCSCCITFVMGAAPVLFLPMSAHWPVATVSQDWQFGRSSGSSLSGNATKSYLTIFVEFGPVVIYAISNILASWVLLVLTDVDVAVAPVMVKLLGFSLEKHVFILIISVCMNVCIVCKIVCRYRNMLTQKWRSNEDIVLYCHSPPYSHEIESLIKSGISWMVNKPQPSSSLFYWVGVAGAMHHHTGLFTGVLWWEFRSCLLTMCS